MNKNNLRKIANELNMIFEGDYKAFIYTICLKFMEVNKIQGKENWLKNYLNFDGKISKKALKILENQDEEFLEISAISWLYQYFISSKKEEIFKNSQKGIKVEKSEIPQATQVFTPNWIVKFLVDNSLKKLQGNLTQIKFLDPCCGTRKYFII